MEHLRPEYRLTLLERREIEARVVGPLIRGFEAAIGREATLAVLRRVITDLARDSGGEAAARLGDATLASLASCVDTWQAGDALEITWLERSDERLEFNVTRCRFAELYKELGLADLGASLSCCRDGAFVEGFGDSLVLRRTQTIMEGASHCDFRFSAVNRGDRSSGPQDPPPPKP
jgi:hypothetical protein